MGLLKDMNLTSLYDVESFGDYYYVEPNFTDPMFFDDMDLCAMSKPITQPALILTIIVGLFGLILNFCVISVVAILKEYRISRMHWFFLHMMVADVIFLLFLLILVVNELQGEWVTGFGTCKISEASLFTTHGAGVAFLVMANLSGILSQFKPIKCPLQQLPKFLRKEIVTSLLILAFIWILCSLINLPLYKFSTLNDCKHCALEFPVTMDEICPMLDFNNTVCAGLMKLLFEEEKLANFSETNSSMFEEIMDQSGDDYKLLVGQNISTMLGLTSCKFEEPRSFYIWLYTTFTFFFLVPLPFLIVYIGLWIYKNKNTEKIKNKSKPKDLLANVIAATSILFILCWAPWNSVQLRKVNGIAHEEGSYCENLASYSRLIAICYNAVLPLVYIILTPDFRFRTLSAIATACQYFPTIWYKDKSNSSQNSEGKIETSDCEMVNCELPASSDDKSQKTDLLPDTNV